jgi:hypothetical protein
MTRAQRKARSQLKSMWNNYWQHLMAVECRDRKK